jgi:hypothetical protein
MSSRKKPRVNIYICYDVMDGPNYPLEELQKKLMQQEEVKEVFLAAKSGPTEEWLKQKLPQSHIMLFLGTERSIKASNCQRALQLAQEEGVGIISIKGRGLSGSALESISPTQIDGEDLTGDFEFFCKRLSTLIVKYKTEVLKMDIALSIFVMMPLQDAKLDQIYEEYIKKTLVKMGYDVDRAGDLFTEGFANILNAISAADIIIADLTGRSPSVFYFLGRAHQQNKDVIQIAQAANDIAADFKQFSTIIYQDTIEGCKTLKTQVEQQVKQHKTKLMGG